MEHHQVVEEKIIVITLNYGVLLILLSLCRVLVLALLVELRNKVIIQPCEHLWTDWTNFYMRIANADRLISIRSAADKPCSWICW